MLVASEKRDLEKASIVEFPYLIHFDKALEVLDYVCKHVPADMTRNITYSQRTDYEDFEVPLVRTKLESVSITGTIYRHRRMVHDAFSMRNESHHDIGIARLVFSPDSRDRLDNTDDSVIRLWDDVRRYVDRYFQEQNRST